MRIKDKSPWRQPAFKPPTRPNCALRKNKRTACKQRPKPRQRSRLSKRLRSARQLGRRSFPRCASRFNRKPR